MATPHFKKGEHWKCINDHGEFCIVKVKYDSNRSDRFSGHVVETNSDRWKIGQHSYSWGLGDWKKVTYFTTPLWKKLNGEI